ncbi:MAG TPA: membrane protein insertase YidC [Trebonia sp.]|jgi:YidC/Oxa1 family membrane protein insertase
MSALLGVPVDAAYHLVLALAGVLTPVLGGLAATAGVVLLTIAVRLIVMPLTFRALRGQAAQARLAPRLAELRKRYRGQPEKLQREMTALYQSEGVSLFAGIWPMLVQWPVFSVLYLLFRSARVAGGANQLLARGLLGVPLGGHWLSGAGAFGPHGLVFLGVFAVLAFACWLSARTARRMMPSLASFGLAPAARKSLSRTVETSPAGAGTLGFLPKALPYVTVIIALFTPLAACVYLITAVAWSTGERELFRRLNTATAVAAPAVC